jgi:hypothetical protein
MKKWQFYLLPVLAMTLGCEQKKDGAKHDQTAGNEKTAATGKADPDNVAGFLTPTDLAEPAKKENIIAEQMTQLMPKLLGFAPPPYSPSAESELDPDIRSQIVISDEICPEKFWQGARINVKDKNLLIIDQETEYKC